MSSPGLAVSQCGLPRSPAVGMCTQKPEFQHPTEAEVRDLSRPPSFQGDASLLHLIFWRIWADKGKTSLQLGGSAGLGLASLHLCHPRCCLLQGFWVLRPEFCASFFTTVTSGISRVEKTETGESYYSSIHVPAASLTSTGSG